MKVKLASISVLLIFSQYSFAFPNSPEHCPSVEAIKSAPTIEALKPGANNKWTFTLGGQFDTKQYWNFLIQDVEGNDVGDAMKNASELLETLTVVSGPVLVPPCPTPPIWQCKYTTKGKIVVAYTTGE